MNDDYPPGAYYVTPAEALEQWAESLQKQNATLKAELREAVRLLGMAQDEECLPGRTERHRSRDRSQELDKPTDTTGAMMVAKISGMGRSRKHPDKKTYSGRLAVRIDELRLKAGYSVEDFQVRLGEKDYAVSIPNLYKWLNGDLQPQIDALPAIAKALGVTIAELLPKS